MTDKLPEGKWMPREPTQAMWEAARDQMPDGHANIEEIYRAMYAASPAAPADAEREAMAEERIANIAHKYAHLIKTLTLQPHSMAELEIQVRLALREAGHGSGEGKK